jgi:hypothetical protein
MSWHVPLGAVRDRGILALSEGARQFADILSARASRQPHLPRNIGEAAPRYSPGVAPLGGWITALRHLATPTALVLKGFSPPLQGRLPATGNPTAPHRQKTGAASIRPGTREPTDHASYPATNALRPLPNPPGSARPQQSAPLATPMIIPGHQPVTSRVGRDKTALRPRIRVVTGCFAQV